MSDVSLREYIERILDERETSHTLQIQSAKKSVEDAAQNLERRLEAMNEFRAQITEERRTYVTTGTIQHMVERIDKLETWQANITGRMAGFGILVVILSAVITAVIGLFSEGASIGGAP